MLLSAIRRHDCRRGTRGRVRHNASRGSLAHRLKPVPPRTGNFGLALASNLVSPLQVARTLVCVLGLPCSCSREFFGEVGVVGQGLNCSQVRAGG